MRLLHPSLLPFCAAVLLTGCGFTADTIALVQTTSKSIHGRIMGGQQPVAGSTVTVYALGTGNSGGLATALASTTTLADGSFEFNTTVGNSYSCPSTEPDTHTVAKASRAAHAVKSELAAGKNKITSTGTTFSTRAQGRPETRPATLPDLTQSYLYVMAAGGDAGGGMNSSILLAAGLGACAYAQNETVEINEVSTVVFANAMQSYSFSGKGFATDGVSLESISAMDLADTNTVQAFVDLSTGLVKPNVVSTEPGGTSITIEAGKIYTLANILASCVNSADDLTDPANPQPSMACQNLYAGLQSDVGNTLGAALQMAYSPYYNVAGLWQLATPKPPFAGGLDAAPNDWTIGISYTTNAMGLGLFPAPDGTPTGSDIDIDSSGRIWFPSNKSGATGVGFFDPTETAFSGPFGGSELKQPQYVALYDDFQFAYVTDVASNAMIAVDTTPGGTNAVEDTFHLVDALGGTETVTTGPLFVNSDGSLSLEYNGSDGVHNFSSFQPEKGIGLILSPLVQAATGLTLNTTGGADPNDPSSPIGVAATSGVSTACSLEVGGDPTVQGNLLPSPVSTTTNPCVSGGAASGNVTPDGNGPGVQDELMTATTSNEICSELEHACFSELMSLASGTMVKLANGPRGIAVDGRGEVWLANAGDQSIALIDPTFTPGRYDTVTDRPYLHDAANGATMTSPAGIAIDSAGNVWVSNATCTSTADTSCSFTLSEVIGIGYPTITPLSNQANQEQGTEPGGVSRPVALERKSIDGARKSGVFVSK